MRSLSKSVQLASVLAVLTPFGVAARGDFRIVAVQLGDGASPVGDTAQAVSLSEFSLAGSTGTLLDSHSIPSTGAAALTLGGAGGHDGHLNVAGNGQYLLLGGYRANAGAPNPVAQSAADVNRVIGRISLSDWSIDTTTALADAYSGGELDAVVSDNGLHFWTAGDGTNNGSPSTGGGLRYVDHLGAGTTTNLSQTQTIPSPSGLDPDSMRSARLVNGQLYITTASQGSFGNRGLYATTDPLPTTGPQTMIPLMNNNEGNSSSSVQEMAPDSKGKWVPKSDIVFADLNPAVPGLDTAYSTGGKNEVAKWSLIDNGLGGYAWKQVQVSTFLNNGNDGLDVNALDLVVNPDDSVDLFVANDAGIYRLIDSTGYVGVQPPAAAGFVTINDVPYYITAPANTKFRGIAIVAVPEPASLGMLAIAALGLLQRRRRIR